MRPPIPELASIFHEICGDHCVFTDADQLYSYGQDATMDLRYSFDILLKPSSPEAIAKVLLVCMEYGIPLTARGGGSGVTGAALPVRGGVVLSMERLNKVIAIAPLEGYVIAEAGVVTADLCNAVKGAGYYLPVEPTSSYSSFVGGNVAITNAGSTKSCKYGKTGEYVLNLEVVLPTGEIFWTGSNMRKNSTGLNLTQLFVGSEGMLGIITKVVYRLIPAPSREILLLAAFRNEEEACRAIVDIKGSALHPCEAELIGMDAVRLTADFLGEPLLLMDHALPVHVLIGIDDGPGIPDSLELAFELLSRYAGENILVAETSQEKERIRRLRLNIGAAMTSGNRRYRDIDICIPLSFLSEYIQKVRAIAVEEEMTIACFGHALDGNLHTMLLSESKSVHEQAKMDRAARKIYSYATGIGGIISGEHGIGFLQKEYLSLQYTNDQLILMNRLKRFFDPKGILNPGKSFTVYHQS